MKKVIVATCLMLAVGGTVMAQTPVKKDTTSTNKKMPVKKHVKKTPAKPVPPKTDATKPQ